MNPLAKLRTICCSVAILFAFTVPASAQHHKLLSLLDYFIDADIVAICTMENAIRPNNELPKGQVDLVLENVFRTHLIIKEKKHLVHPVHVPATKVRHIIAVHVEEKKTFAYFALELDQQGELERFVRASIPLKERSQVARARFAYDYLLSPNKLVADSADIEFSRASYGDIRKIAEKVTPDSCLMAIKNSKPSLISVRWHALLLGHCGKKEDAMVLREAIDKSNKSASNACAEMFISLVLLDREEGWRIVTETLVGKGTRFLNRYSALQAARFYFKDRKDVIEEKMSLAAIASALNVPEIADFAVEDLRKWKRWEYCDTILKLPIKAGHDGLIMRKSILRFALQCPTQQAKDYVKAERARDSEYVEEVEELLALENEQPTPPRKEENRHP